MFQKLINNIDTYTRELVVQTLKENRQIIPCVAGKKMAVLYEDGTLAPCELLENIAPINKTNDYNFGNIRDFDYDIPKILTSLKAKKIQKYIKDTKCYCTFECAINANIIYSPKHLLYSLLRPDNKYVN